MAYNIHRRVPEIGPAPVSGGGAPGLQAFITYLVDPFPYPANRKQSERVWAVRCTESWPSNDDGGIIAEESLKNWDKKLLELMADLSRFIDFAIVDN